MLASLLEQWGGDTIFVRGRPQHSHSQGLVESGNLTIEDKLAKLRMEHDPTKHGGAIFSWAGVLPRFMYVLNTQESLTTKQVTFEVVYGQQAHGNFFQVAELLMLKISLATML